MVSLIDLLQLALNDKKGCDFSYLWGFYSGQFFHLNICRLKPIRVFLEMERNLEKIDGEFRGFKGIGYVDLE